MVETFFLVVLRKTKIAALLFVQCPLRNTGFAFFAWFFSFSKRGAA
jgi:hypothetical protein